MSYAITMYLFIPIYFQFLVYTKNILIYFLGSFVLVFSHLLLDVLDDRSLDVYCWLKECAVSKIFSNDFVGIEGY